MMCFDQVNRLLARSTSSGDGFGGGEDAGDAGTFDALRLDFLALRERAEGGREGVFV